MLSGVLALLSIALLLRIGMGRMQEEEWSSKVDLPLALVAGIFYAWSCLELAAFHGGTDPVIEGKILISSISTDFMEYCGGLGSMMLQDPEAWPPKRSRGAAWLPSLFADSLGILDGLALSAVVSCGLIGGGLYLWGRAVGGRTAGLVAMLAALAMGPMVLLSRMLSFYPEIIASFVLAAAATTWAIRLRTPVCMVLAGVAIGAVLLIDVRGLMWALPFLGGAGVAAGFGREPDEDSTSRSRWIGRGILLLCLCIPIALSYPLGEWAFPARTTSLESQLDLRPLFATHGATGADFVGPFETETAYRWGWSSIFEIPATLGFVLEQSRFSVPEGLAASEGVGSSEQHIDPWLLLGACGVIAAPFVLRFERWRVWALFCTIFPFAIALRGMDVVEEMQPRILTHWMPGVALLTGLAFEAIRSLPGPRGLLDRVWLAPKWRLRAGTLALTVFGVLLLISGTVPSWWAPDSDWRTRWDQDQLLVPYGLSEESSFRDDLRSERITGPEGAATADIGGGYSAETRAACWSGLDRDWNRGIHWEIRSHARPFSMMGSVLSNGLAQLFGSGIPRPADLPEGVFVHVEERGTTLIVGFVGESGTPKDSLLLAEVEADRRYSDQCRGAYLSRTWTHEAIGWEGLLMGVLLEVSGSDGLTADRSTVDALEYDIWARMEDWSDVRVEALDSTHLHHETLTTSDDTDDCDQDNLRNSATWAETYDFGDPVDWRDSPTSRVYIRESTPLIDELTEMGRIRYR